MHFMVLYGWIFKIFLLDVSWHFLEWCPKTQVVRLEVQKELCTGRLVWMGASQQWNAVWDTTYCAEACGYCGAVSVDR